MSDDYSAKISRDVQELMRQIENTANSEKIARLRTEIDLLTRTFFYEQQREITEKAVPEILKICGKYVVRIVRFEYQYMSFVNLAVLVLDCPPKCSTDILRKFKALDETFSENYFGDALYLVLADATNLPKEAFYKEISAGTIVWEADNEQEPQYAVGDIQLDGITPTTEFQEYAEKEKRGELSLEDKQQFLRKPYTTEEPPANEVHALSERFLEQNKEAYKSLTSEHKERPE